MSEPHTRGCIAGDIDSECPAGGDMSEQAEQSGGQSRAARDAAIRKAADVVQEGATPFIRRAQGACTCWRDGQELTTSSEVECPAHGDMAWSGLRALSDERLLDLLAEVRQEVRRRDPGPPDASEVAEYSALADAYTNPDEERSP